MVFAIFPNTISAQNDTNAELNRLWDQAEFWEKTGNANKTIEYKEKLLELYRKKYMQDLPVMLRNIANTYASYGSLSDSYKSKSEEYFIEALALISNKQINDDNLTLYYNCLWDMIGWSFERKDYSKLLSEIHNYSDYLIKDNLKIHKEEVANIRKAKYNAIFQLNDSCQKLKNNGEYEIAFNIMNPYAPEFIEILAKDSLDDDICYLSLATVWLYADIIAYVEGEKEKSIELYELHNKFLRNNLDFYIKKGLSRDYLWVMERSLANTYGDLGYRQKEIDISEKIVNEARVLAPELFPSKLFDLGISYDDATEEGRYKAQESYMEALEAIDQQTTNHDVIEMKLRIIDQLLAQFVLNVQYDKAIAVFEKYKSFLKECDNQENEALLMNILEWETSTYHYLDYSIPNSREKAREINVKLLEYQFRLHGEKSIGYLDQLRSNAISGTFSDAEVDSLYSKGYILWQEMPKIENAAKYTSFLASYINFQQTHREVVDKSLFSEINRLFDNPQTDFHTKLNFYYNFSVSEYNNWNYYKALEYINKAEEICESHKDASEIKERLTQVLTQKSLVAFCLDDLSMSKECAYKAYDIAKSFQFNNLNIANILSSLSYVFEIFGDKKTALELSTKSFNVRYMCEGNAIQLDAVNEVLRLLGPKEQLKLIDTLHIEHFMQNPKVVPILLTKARSQIILGLYNEADSCLNIADKCLSLFKGIDIYKNEMAYNLIKADIALNRGMLCYYDNRIGEAITYFKECKDFKQDKDVQPLLWLNTMYAIVQDSVNFQKETQLTLNHIKNEIKKRFVFLSNHEREIYMRDMISMTINEMESYAYIYPNNPQARLFAYNAVLLEKGLALSSSSKIADYMYSHHIDNNHLSELRKQFELANNPQERSSIQMRIDMEEQRLQKSIDIDSIMSDIIVDVESIKKSLNPSDIMVEFIRYVSNTNNRMNETEYHIGALILTSDCEAPYFVDLCSESKLKDMQSKGYVLYDNTSELYKLIWLPLEKYIQKHKYVYFSPVGLLHMLNIEYAAEKEYNGIAFIRISSSRILMSGKKHNLHLGSVCIFGGLCYDCIIDSPKPKDNHVNYLNTIVNDTITRSSLAYLPGSYDEVRNITDCLLKAQVQVTMFCKDKGTEDSFKGLSGKDVSILHLSTHGFSYGHNSVKDYDEPMRKCGLLLSGCQNVWNGGKQLGSEDGILLGEEISNVQINGNQLVVLSACETGLGVTTPEGVWGLQRAFKKAGAGSILMSLWKVNDIATDMLMTEFYKNLCAGKSQRESLKDAQQHVREFQNDDGDKPFINPSYWAAWILLDAIN